MALTWWGGTWMARWWDSIDQEWALALEPADEWQEAIVWDGLATTGSSRCC